MYLMLKTMSSKWTIQPKKWRHKKRHATTWAVIDKNCDIWMKRISCSNGSVVVRCVVLLKRPLAEGERRVGFTFLKALEEGKGILLPGLFYVDVHTVTFTGTCDYY